MGVVAPGVVAATVGVATPTTAAGVTAVAEAEEARLGLMVAPVAAKEVASDEATRPVAAALGEATGDIGTVQEAVPTGTAHPPRLACLRLRARTTAR